MADNKVDAFNASRALMSLLQIGGGAGPNLTDDAYTPRASPSPTNAGHAVSRPSSVTPQHPCVSVSFEDGVADVAGEHVELTLGEGGTAGGAQRVEVQTFTLYASVATPHVGRLVAANSTYVAYAVKVKSGWGVRVLHLHTARKALLRGHVSMIADMQFSEHDENVIATVDQRGDLIIHRLRDAPDEILGDIELCVRAAAGTVESGHHRVLWLGGRADPVLAASHDSAVELWHLARLDDSAHARDSQRAQLMHAVTDLTGHTASVRELACTDDRQLLATCSDDGTVRFWDLSGACVRTWRPHGGAGVSFVAFVSGGRLVVTGADDNTTLRLWADQCARLVQTVTLRTSAPGGLRCARDASGDYVVLAGAVPRPTMCVLALKHRFVQAREVLMAQPVLSFAPATTENVKEEEETEEEDGDGSGKTVPMVAMHIYAVQTKAIQRLSLKFPPTPQEHVLVTVEDDGAEAAPADEDEAEEPLDSRGLNLWSPMELLATEQGAGVGADERPATPATSPAVMGPPTPSPPVTPQPVSPLPRPTLSPHMPPPSAPPAPQLDISALANIVDELLRQSETRMSAHVDHALETRWRAFEAEQYQREAKLEEKMRTEVLGCVRECVGPAVQNSLGGIEDSVARQVDATMRSGAVADMLAQPLTAAFTQAIHANLVPAYEALTQNMMAQLKQTLDHATAEYLEHVQREVAVHGTPRAIQGTLSELHTAVAGLKAAQAAHTAAVTTAMHDVAAAVHADVKESVRSIVKEETRELLRLQQATIAAARPVPPPQPAPQAYAGPPQYRTGAPQPTGPAPMPVAPQPQPATPTHAATAPPAPAIAQQPPSASRPQVISQHPQPPQQQQQQQPAPRPASHTPTQQQPATDKPGVSDVWTQINKDLIQEDYAGAFSKALSSMNLGVVLRLCRTVDIDGVLRTRPCPLSQPVLLSLMQQLSVDLMHDTTLKTTIITEALRKVDPAAPVPRMHLPRLMPQIHTNVRQAYTQLARSPDGPALHALLTYIDSLTQRLAA